MNKKEEIKKILMDSFDCIYCDNCKFKSINKEDSYNKYGIYGCDSCEVIYTYPGWELSEEFVEKVAKQIYFLYEYR